MADWGGEPAGKDSDERATCIMSAQSLAVLLVTVRVKRRSWGQSRREAGRQRGQVQSGRATCALEAVCSVKGLRYAIGDMRRIRTRCRYAGGRGVNWPSSWREWRFASNASSVVRTRPITRLACLIAQPQPPQRLLPFRLVSRMPVQPVHLLRALLREASYLPDATARSYFRRYIVHRYKAYQPRQNATASFDVHAVDKYRHRSFKRRQTAIINERTRPLLRRGVKGLNFLRRANQGEISCLQKVLFFAYGRMGRRKYALLENILKPDRIMDGGAIAASNEAGPAPLQKLYYSNKRYLQYFDAPKAADKTHHTIKISSRYSRLRAVLRTQQEKAISINRELKSSAMKTPINNSWERPMPIKRARNNVRRWYAETMTRMLPPLPTEEWDNIYAMMVGDRKIGLAKRRGHGTALNADPVTEDELFASTVEKGIALDKPSKADKPAGIQRPHAITTRFMQRMYTKLLMLCCKLEWDDDQKRWKAIWGEAMKTIKPSLYNAPTDEMLFAGVDATGKIPRAPKKHALAKSLHVQPRNSEGEYMRFPFFAEQLPEDNPIRKELDEWKRKRAAAAARAKKQKAS